MGAYDSVPNRNKERALVDFFTNDMRPEDYSHSAYVRVTHPDKNTTAHHKGDIARLSRGLTTWSNERNSNWFKSIPGERNIIN